MTLLTHAATVITSGCPLRLACYGSSTTEGYGASTPAVTGYVPRLAALLRPKIPGGIALFNHGVSGENAIGMGARLDAVLSDRPDLVIWQTGSNDATAPDAAEPAALDRFVALTSAGLDAFAAMGADVVLMDLQYSRNLEAAPRRAAYLDALHRLARERALAVYPRYEIMRGWVADGRATIDALSPDGTHMVDEGYDWLARSVSGWLAPKLGIAPPDAAPAVSA